MSADDKKNQPDQKPEGVETAGTPTEDQAVSQSVPDTEASREAEVVEEAAEPAATDSTADEKAEPGTTPESVTVLQNTPARSDGFARFVAVVALLVSIAVLALSQFPQVPKGSAAKLAAVEGKVATLASAPAPAASAAAEPGPEIAELRNQLAAAEDRLANLSLLIDEMRTAQSQAAETAGPSADTADTSALEERIASLAAQIEALAERPEQAPTTVTVQPAAAEGTAELEAQLETLTADLAALRSDLARVEGRQTDIAGTIGTGDESVRDELRAAIDAASAALTAQVNTIAETARQSTEAGNSELAGKAALVLAAGRLKDAAAGSAPFSGAWQAIEALGVAPSDYPAIPAAAASGVPTIEQLKTGFADEASRAIVADKVGSDGTWVEGALKRVGSLVKVRRTGDLEGEEVEAVVARAEVRLASDDLAGALAELETLQGAAAEEISDWVANGKRRLALNTDVEALQASILADLAGSD